MKQYKNYLIDAFSWSNEIKIYDGHRFEGTGEYESGTAYKIIHTKTGKQISDFKTTAEAERYIDEWLTALAAKKLRSLYKRRITIGKKIAKLKEEIAELERQDEHVAAKLPPKTWY